MVVHAPRAGLPGRCFALTGGLLFAGSLVYFLVAYRQFGQAAGPWSSGGSWAMAWNAFLFSLFALHHSVFARTGLKDAISARISRPLERSVYVWVSSLLFGATLWAWASVPGEAWHVSGTGAWLIDLGWIGGLLLTAVAASALDPLELAGIRQAFGRPVTETGVLSTTGVYALVRHPVYLGWVLLVWCVPVMTGTRLVFAAVSTFYLIVAIPLEERQMRRTLGEPYDRYAAAVRWRLLPGLY